MDNYLVQFGGTKWTDTPIIIQAFGETILGISINEENGLLELSGIFHDKEDEEIFRIEKSEWKGNSEYFDIEVEGRRIIIRKKLREIALQINLEPPNLFTIEKIDMSFRGAKITGSIDKGFIASSPDGSTIAVSNAIGESCAVGVLIDKNSIVMGCRCKSMRF